MNKAEYKKHELRKTIRILEYSVEYASWLIRGEDRNAQKREWYTLVDLVKAAIDTSKFYQVNRDTMDIMNEMLVEIVERLKLEACDAVNVFEVRDKIHMLLRDFRVLPEGEEHTTTPFMALLDGFRTSGANWIKLGKYFSLSSIFFFLLVAVALLSLGTGTIFWIPPFSFGFLNINIGIAFRETGEQRIWFADMLSPETAQITNGDLKSGVIPGSA